MLLSAILVLPPAGNSESGPSGPLFCLQAERLRLGCILHLLLQQIKDDKLRQWVHLEPEGHLTCLQFFSLLPVTGVLSAENQRIKSVFPQFSTPYPPTGLLKLRIYDFGVFVII